MGSFLYQYLGSYEYLQGDKLLVLFFGYCFCPKSQYGLCILRAAVLPLLADGPLYSANEPVHFNTQLFFSLRRTGENSETSELPVGRTTLSLLVGSRILPGIYLGTCSFKRMINATGRFYDCSLEV